MLPGCAAPTFCGRDKRVLALFRGPHLHVTWLCGTNFLREGQARTCAFPGSAPACYLAVRHQLFAGGTSAYLRFSGVRTCMLPGCAAPTFCGRDKRVLALFRGPHLHVTWLC